MNKKTKTYLLLTAVAVIWGTVGFQIYNGLEGSKVIAEIEIPKTQLYPIHNRERDTFSLKPITRDPFLDKPVVTPNKNRSKSSASKVNKQPFPSVIYHGTLSQNGSSIYIISLNGTQMMLKKGQVQNGLSVIGGNTNSVTLKYANQVKSFSKI